MLSDKTPRSGPGAFKARTGRKRRRNNAEPLGDEQMESLDNEYRGEYMYLEKNCRSLYM